jgi:hypothetical protein
MASAEALPQEVLEAVAQQIGERLSGASQQALSSGEGLEIAESFPIWAMGLAATVDPGVDLGRSAYPTGYWHHQIRHGARAIEFAKSRSTGPRAEDWRVEEIVTSPIAEKIDSAVRWLDDNVRDDGLVRLLVVPAYFIHALWIESPGGSRILLVDRPDSLSALAYNHLYPARDFFQLLARQQHVVGVPPEQANR